MGVIRDYIEDNNPIRHQGENLQASNARHRPVDQGLLHTRFPVGAVVSIIHRVTGVALVVMFPAALYLLQGSLSDAGRFEALRMGLVRPEGHLLAGLAVWPLAHHFYAGIRHLLLDLDIGADLKAARLSAWLVLVAGFGTAALVAAAL